MKDIRQGERFPHDVVLAALAVALESWNGLVADEYLHQLANLQNAEMSLSIRVARECLERRNAVAASQKENGNGANGKMDNQSWKRKTGTAETEEETLKFGANANGDS